MRYIRRSVEGTYLSINKHVVGIPEHIPLNFSAKKSRICAQIWFGVLIPEHTGFSLGMTSREERNKIRPQHG
jgi:hypothetical protein